MEHRVAGFTGQSPGSVRTSIQMSFRISAYASRMALCRKLTYGPRLQDRQWSMSFFLPQTQKRGTLGIDHPYLRHILSLNSCLLRQYPRHFRGSADNHDEAPFSQFNRITFFFIKDGLSEISCSWAFRSSSLACLIATFLAFIVFFRKGHIFSQTT